VRLSDARVSSLEKGAGALAYFVAPWGLPLNPEELEELAYAVLVHHDSTASWDEIRAAVEEQIAEVPQGRESLQATYRTKSEAGPDASA
jgi:hypothetical protein